MLNQNIKSQVKCQQEFNLTDPKVIFQFPEWEIRQINKRNALIEIFDGFVKAIVIKGNRFSQDYVAAITGYNIDTVNKYIKKLEKMGLLLHLNMGYKQTCLYKISSYFHKKEVIEALKDIIPSLKLLLLVVVLKSNNNIFEKQNKLQSELIGLSNKYNKYEEYKEQKKEKEPDSSSEEPIRKRNKDTGYPVFNLFSINKEVGMLDKIKAEFRLTDEQVSRLSCFEEKILTTGYVQFKKAEKTGIRMSSRIGYFTGICRNLQQKQENHQKSNTIKENPNNDISIAKQEFRDLKRILKQNWTIQELQEKLQWYHDNPIEVDNDFTKQLFDLREKEIFAIKTELSNRLSV